MSRFVFKAVDRLFRDIMEEPRYPFGGKTFVLGGDFRQCLPVIPRASPTQVVNMCLNHADFWDQVTVLRLHMNMRVQFHHQRGSPHEAAMLQEWCDYLKRVGDDTEPKYPQDHQFFPEWINAPASIASPCTNEMDFCRSIYQEYGQMATVAEKEEFFRSRAILCPTNASADDINEMIITSDILGEDFSQQEARVFHACNSIVEPALRNHCPQDLLDKHEQSGLPPHKLVLKVGCPIIMMRNYARRYGVVNGTRLIITEIHDHSVKARILTGNSAFWGREVLIGKVAIKCTDTEHFGATLNRVQFPFRVSLAMTINKSQGLTLKQVGLHLATQVFSHGQLYVALSRVGKPEAITVYQPDNLRDSDQDPLPVKNCVFTDALLPPERHIPHNDLDNDNY